MNKKIILIFLVVILGISLYFGLRKSSPPPTKEGQDQEFLMEENSESEEVHPMDIEKLRQANYPGSEIIIKENLENGSNYSRYIASYQSEGNKIFGLLTIPFGKENEKFPIIVFVHGYIPPNEYKTIERYVAYQDGIARNGFITYKIDLRGHGDSEGEPANGHYSPFYVIDTLNAISSLKKLEKANSEKIGYWGHSNGGEIGLRTMVISSEIDAGVFWAGVVGSFQDMLETYNSKIGFLNLERNMPSIVRENRLPSQNPEFWQKIDPYYFLDEISGPVQLHHGTADSSVPIELSRQLNDVLESRGKIVELYEYEGGDHNLSNPDFGPAMEETVEFYKKYLN